MNKISLPKGWMWTTLQKVCLPPQYGWTTKASPQGKLHLLRTTDITTDSLNWVRVPFCSEEPPKKEKYMLKTGDIVISRAGSVGYSYLVENPPPAVFASYLIRFRPLPILNEHYLAFFLKSSFYWNTILSEKTGSTLPNVNATKLKRVPIPLPPLSDQRAIAHALQTIQEAKTSRQREIALEREHKAALMDYLFSHGTKGEPRKQTEIGEIPESWEVVRFEKVVTFTKKPRDLQYANYSEIPFVPMDLVPIAKLFSEGFISKTNNELKSGTYFEPGDILLSKITPSFENGKQCIIQDLPTPFGIATTEVIPIREVTGVSDKTYLFYYLLLRDVRTLLAGKMQGTTGRQRLTKDALVNMEIPLPSLPEQRAIATVFRAIDEKMETLEQEVQHLDELFHAMLEELMTGQRSAMPLIENGVIQ